MTLLDTAEVLDEALAGLRDPIAVDTEFHAEFRRVPRLMLVQLCGAGGEPLLVDPRAIEDLRPLGQALTGRRLLLHAATQDVLLLRRCAGLGDADILDVQVLAGLVGLGYPRSLDDLKHEALGQAPSRSLGLTDWSQRPLTADQLAYAAADVRDLHALEDALRGRAGQADLAGAATRDLLERALAPVDPEQLWRRFAAARVLDGLGREVLRRIVRWREGVSQATNKPRGAVLGDGVMFDVARRAPATLDDLASNRRFPKGVLKKHGAQLLQIVAEARAADEHPPHVPRADDRAVALEALLRAWAEAVAARDRVSPRLLLPPELIDALLEAQIGGAPPDLGWRQAPYGAELDALRRGDVRVGWHPELGPTIG